MCQVTTGKRPYDGISDADIRSLFQKGEFPDVISVGHLGGHYQNLLDRWLREEQSFAKGFQR
jgi:hypothetical protein